MDAGVGRRLRALRKKRGLGLKRVAPEIGVSYTYLSKVENGKAAVSESVIERLAKYYSVDDESLAAQAGHLPDDVKEILANHPEEALALLRRHFGR